MCIFCKIVNGEIPSYKVYEDEIVLAFFDIMPVNAGHVLVIPKNHFANFEEIPEDVLCEVIKTVKKIGLAVKQGLGVEGYNVTVNNDPVAGQAVPHLHFHIIPRHAGDGLHFWPQKKYEAGEAEVFLQKIKSGL